MHTKRERVILDFLTADGSEDAGRLLAGGRFFRLRSDAFSFVGRHPIAIGRPNECFNNSLAVAVTLPNEWRYCEGVCLIRGTEKPAHHAWLIDHKSRVREDTPTTPGLAYFGAVFPDIDQWREIALSGGKVARFKFNTAPCIAGPEMSSDDFIAKRTILIEHTQGKATV